MDTREKHIFYLLFLLLTASASIAVLVLFILHMTGEQTSGSSPPFSITISDRVVRGSIYDSQHRLLAMEVPVYALSLWTPNITDPESIARLASRHLGLSETETLHRISSRQGFLYLARGIDHAAARLIAEDITSRNIAGVTLEKHYGRYYPFHDMASQTIGFTNLSNEGAAGIEYFYENQLHPLPLPGRETTYGNELVLTLSVPFQVMLDNALESIMHDHNPDGVSGVIMDGLTGDILALSSHPSFDLNSASLSLEAQRTNRAVTSMYEPGSVFKVYSLAAILEELGLDHEPFYCRGSHTHTLPGGRSVVINCTRAHGEVSLGDIIKYSCNNAIAALALKADTPQFYQRLLDFGFSQRTNAGLPGESPGLIHPPDAWSERSKPTIAFGQESGMTALQAASAATVFTNNGVRLLPHIVKEIISPDGGILYQREVTGIKQVISPELAEKMVFFMETAVERGGTANRMHTPGLLLAAKTGTAQLPEPGTAAYSNTRYLASTLALVPGNDTTYIIYIAADYPKAGSIYGATVVVPYIKDIVDQALISGYVTPKW